MGPLPLTTAQARSPVEQVDPVALANCSERLAAAHVAGGKFTSEPPTIAGTGAFAALLQAGSHLYTLIVGLVPPLVNAETAKTSPVLWTSGPKPPPSCASTSFWKNQIPMLESPFTAKRSAPNTKTVEPFVYSAAYPFVKKSLSGTVSAAFHC